MNRLLRDSFIGGIFIGLGCIANILSSNPILGSFLFSLGLLSIVVQKRKLYTGVIGYLSSLTDTFSYLLILIFNLLGIGFICFLFQNIIDSSAICELKYNETLYMSFVKSLACGMLMYMAVEGYKRTEKPITIILPIMMFIICGFDHCIANYGYMILNGDIFCPQLPIWIIGNSIGSLIISKI